MKKIFIIAFFLFVSKINFAQTDTVQIEFVYQKFYYPNNNVSSEGYLKNNIPVGFWKSYYITGVIKSEGKCKNIFAVQICKFVLYSC